MTPNACAATRSRRPEIEALGILSSQAAVMERLEKLAGCYGKVIAVSPLPEKYPGGAGGHAFAVCFEKTQDAMTASRDLRCLQIGFSMLLVPVTLCRDALAS